MTLDTPHVADTSTAPAVPTLLRWLVATSLSIVGICAGAVEFVVSAAMIVALVAAAEALVLASRFGLGERSKAHENQHV